MRILALRPEGYVIPFIHISMVKGFRSLGHEVLYLPYPRDKAAMNVIRSMASTGPAAVFSLDLPLVQELRNNLIEFQRSIKIPWIIWFVDDPDGYGFPKGFDTEWTIVFCWDGEIARQISAQDTWKGIQPIHLPLATDPDLFYPGGESMPLLFPAGVFVGSTAHPNPIFDEAIFNSPGFEEDVWALWKIWKIDLTQIPQELAWGYLQKKAGTDLGTLRKDPLARLWSHSIVYALGREKRIKIVSQIIREGGGVFGNQEWRKSMGNIYRGEATYGEQLRKIYQRSAFVLETRQPQSRTALTQRIFDASACGIPVLAEHSPELEECFSLKEEMIPFRTLDEAREEKEKILSPSDSSSRALKARNRVLALHTYRHRAARIIEAIQPFFGVSRA